MTTTEQTITEGTKVRHITKGWTATVTSLYIAPGYGCLTAGLKFDVGVGTCVVENLEIAA